MANIGELIINRHAYLFEKHKCSNADVRKISRRGQLLRRMVVRYLRRRPRPTIKLPECVGP